MLHGAVACCHIAMHAHMTMHGKSALLQTAQTLVESQRVAASTPCGWGLLHTATCICISLHTHPGGVAHCAAINMVQHAACSCRTTEREPRRGECRAAHASLYAAHRGLRVANPRAWPSRAAPTSCCAQLRPWGVKVQGARQQQRDCQW
jgi:hypothetical protein